MKSPHVFSLLTGAPMHDKFPVMWDIVKQPFDDALSEHYENLVETPSKIHRFLSKMRHALTILWGRDDLAELIAVDGQFTLSVQAVARVMQTGQTGFSVFSSAWLACSREIFRSRTMQAIESLELDEFAADRTELFTKMMDQQVQKLREEGHKRGKHKWLGGVTMFACAMNVRSDFAGDEYEDLHWARVKSILVNTRQEKPLPWEELLFLKGRFSNCPQRIQLPDKVIAPMRSLRAFIFELIDVDMTLSDMTKTMKRVPAT